MSNISEMSVSNMEQIPKERIWDLDAKFDIECERIKFWIKKQAQQNLMPDGSNLGKVKELANGVVRELKETFYDDHVNMDPEQLATAKEILRTKTADSTITTWFWIRNIVGFLELVVFGVQFLLEFEDWGQALIFVPAFILLLGALSAGYGLAYIIFPKEVKKDVNKRTRIIALIGGVIAIGVATIMRAWNAKKFYFVTFFTLGLGAFIVAVETVYEDYKKTREHHRKIVYDTQGMLAASRHCRLFNDMHWEKAYLHEIDMIMGTHRDVQQGNKTV